MVIAKPKTHEWFSKNWTHSPLSFQVHLLAVGVDLVEMWAEYKHVAHIYPLGSLCRKGWTVTLVPFTFMGQHF